MSMGRASNGGAACRHWLVKCFQKPFLACMTVSVAGLQMIEGVTGKQPIRTRLFRSRDWLSANQGVTGWWDCLNNLNNINSSINSTSPPLIDPPPTTFNIPPLPQVYKKNVLGSGLIGSSSLPLPEIFGSVQRIDETKDKEVLLRLRDKNNLNLNSAEGDSEFLYGPYGRLEIINQLIDSGLN
eukprot:sb/3471557/